jgi:hypothetical protein
MIQTLLIILIVLACFTAYKIGNNRIVRRGFMWLLCWNSITRQFIYDCIDGKNDGTYTSFKNQKPPRIALVDYRLTQIRGYLLITGVAICSIKFTFFV